MRVMQSASQLASVNVRIIDRINASKPPLLTGGDAKHLSDSMTQRFDRRQKQA
jgi:hypothetical protein